MLKTIAVRGKKNIVAVFCKYSQVSGQQDTSRPKATADFIDFISGLPLDEMTALKLKKASKQHIDESEIADDSVPSFIKITVDVDEATWEKAMSVFRYVFSLKNDPQMPYFLRVAGTAYIHNLEEQDLACVQKTVTERSGNISFEKFQTLDVDNKLNEIYKLLLERRNES